MWEGRGTGKGGICRINEYQVGAKCTRNAIRRWWGRGGGGELKLLHGWLEIYKEIISPVTNAQQ